MAKTKLARALVDIGPHGVKAGQLVESDAASIDQLAKEGQVDAHRDAVAYARNEGKAVVKIEPFVTSAASAAAAARLTALQQQLANAEGRLQAAPEADREAAQKAVDELRAQVAELEG